MDWNFRISPNIVLGEWSFTRLGQLVAEFGTKYMLLVDPALDTTDMLGKIETSLKDRSIGYFSYALPSSTVNEIERLSFPNTKDLEDILALARNAHVDGIIACGGERLLCIARCLCALYNEGRTVCDVVDSGIIEKHPIALVCVPTAMCTPFIFMSELYIQDSRTRQLKCVKASAGMCKLAIFDPNLCSEYCDTQIESLQLEVLTMAIESLILSTGGFFTDMLCYKALELYVNSIKSSEAEETGESMMLLEGAGCLASLAVAGTALGADALLSLAISARNNIPRSLTAPIFLPHVIDVTGGSKGAILERVKQLLGIEGTIQDYVRGRLEQAGLSLKLSDIWLTMEELSQAAEDAGSLQSLISSDVLFTMVKLSF